MDHLARQRRVVDMMLTMHSVLRDRYQCRAAVFDVAVLVLSTFICGVTFASDAVLMKLGLPPGTGTFSVGLAGIALFALSVVSMQVGWKEQSGAHDRACQVLARLKGQLRGAEVPIEAERFAAELSDLVPIPDGQFIKLKARHARKVGLSKALGRFPASPLWVIRLRLALRDIRAVVREGTGGNDGGGDD